MKLKQWNISFNSDFSDATYNQLITCLIEDIDCIQNAHNQVKRNKHETTIYIHGYRGIKDTTSVPDIISGINDNKFFSYIYSIIWWFI